MDEILNRYDKKRTEAQELIEQKRTEDEMFFEDFKRVRQEIIRPVLESIGDQLRSRGHDYRIEEQEAATDTQGRPQSPLIGLNIYPSGVERSRYRPDCTPRIAFVGQVSKKNLYSHVNTIGPEGGGAAGARDSFSLMEINTDIVEKQVLKAVGDIFK